MNHSALEAQAARPARSQRHRPCHVRLGAAALACCGVVGCRPSDAREATTSRPSAQRIISISPNATEIIGLLGQADRLVGVSTFCIWPPDIEKLPRIGGLFDPNLEEIVRLHPDLIILRGRNQAVERLCAERVIGIFRDQTETFENIYATTRELGRLLGCSGRADRVVGESRAGLERIRRAVVERRRPRVLLTLSRNADDLGQVMTATRGTYMHEVIDQAGGENVFAGLSVAYPQVSVEAILTAQPEVIIETMPETKPSLHLREKLVGQWRGLGPIPAVRTDRIYVITDPHAQIPSPRIVEIVAAIAKLLHPEAKLD